VNVAFDCIPCTVQSCLRLLDAGFVDESRREDLLRRTLAFLAEVDYDQSPPALAQTMHRMFRETLDDPDPYRDIKRDCNQMMMDRRPDLREMVRNSDDPLGTAIRLAVAGNVIDFGAKNLFDPLETIAAVLDGDLDIDDSAQLQSDMESARSVLYIGDNAGEIVTDSVLLETLDHPGVTFVVRGGPVINDATIEDARLVGIDRLARVITTGDDAPGVIWETSSAEFRRAFAEADVVVAKGQGNLEGLIDMKRTIYFLLTTKCERIAEHIGVGEKAFVVWKMKGQDINI